MDAVFVAEIFSAEKETAPLFHSWVIARPGTSAVTTLVAVVVVNAPVLGVPPPMGPGLAK